MRIGIRRLWIVLSILLAPLAITGCNSNGHIEFLGYTSEPPFDMSIQSIYLPIALNTTYRKGLEFDLTKAVQREIMTKSPYRLVSDPSRADTELILKIVNRRKTVILPNQLNENRDAEVAISIEVVWRDLRPGKRGDILSNPKRFDPNEQPLPGMPAATAPKAVPVLVVPLADFVPELGGSITSAEWRAINLAAIQIVQQMEKWK